MPTFKFAKLVRDKIVEHQLASGAQPQYRQLSLSEHRRALVEKIAEEAQEILGAKPSERASEMSDVQQALDDLRRSFGLTTHQVKLEQQRKKTKNGTFAKGIYIEAVVSDETNVWTAYYRQHAERYPELPDSCS